VFAVNAVAVACPVLVLVAVVLALELANVPDAPLDGAVNVTETPATGLPWASLTIATSWFAKAVCTVADWPEPDATLTVLAGPAVSVSDAEPLVAVHERQYAVTWYV
jgi:hypothetical protein